MHGGAGSTELQVLHVTVLQRQNNREYPVNAALNRHAKRDYPGFTTPSANSALTLKNICAGNRATRGNFHAKLHKEKTILRRGGVATKSR